MSLKYLLRTFGILLACQLRFFSSAFIVQPRIITTLRSIGTESSHCFVNHNQQPQQQHPEKRVLFFSSFVSDDRDDNSNDDTDGDEMFMASLSQRISQVSRKEQRLPLVVLDSMLPRQVLNITVRNDLLLNLIRDRLQEESPRFGMLGNAKLAPNNDREQKTITLTSGVEVEVVGKPHMTARGFQVSLKGKRRFRIVDGTVEKTPQGWTQSQVKFLNSTLDDDAEWSSEDPMSIARAMQMAKEFTDPNMAMMECKSLVDMWLDLARTKERQPGQVDQILRDIGPVPDWKTPSECAFWVGALINPIPAMGVAVEIRPQLLLAKTAEERTQIALDALWNSIQHMEGVNRFEQRKE